MSSPENGKPSAEKPIMLLIGLKFFDNQKELQKSLSECSRAQNFEEALKDYFLSHEMFSAQNVHRLQRAAKVLEMKKKNSSSAPLQFEKDSSIKVY